MRHIASLGAVAMALPAIAAAGVPSVATDIAPVHSLVSQVMGDLGAPSLIVPPGASPHGHAMRPSEARALAGADLVVWVGEGLEPWLADSIASLAEAAEVLELMEVPGTLALDFREESVFGHGEEDHPEKDGGPEAAHGHHGADPHAWLDPRNGQAWLGAIAAALSEADPDNAARYAANAAAARAGLDALETRIAAELEPIKGARFIVLHDAFQYFETRFGLSSIGAVSLSDATDPSAAGVAALRAAVRQERIACVVVEPQFNPALVDAVAEGAGAATVVLDPLGVSLEPGPDLYPRLLRDIAEGFAGCR